MSLETLQTSISVENALICIGTLTTLIKHNDEKVQQFVNDLTPEPTSLFIDGCMRKTKKSILRNHILEVSTKESTKPVAGTCAVDEGNLLHNKRWGLPCTHSDILDQCLQYTPSYIYHRF